MRTVQGIRSETGRVVLAKKRFLSPFLAVASMFLTHSCFAFFQVTTLSPAIFTTPAVSSTALGTVPLVAPLADPLTAAKVPIEAPSASVAARLERASPDVTSVNEVAPLDTSRGYVYSGQSARMRAVSSFHAPIPYRSAPTAMERYAAVSSSAIAPASPNPQASIALQALQTTALQTTMGSEMQFSTKSRSDASFGGEISRMRLEDGMSGSIYQLTQKYPEISQRNALDRLGKGQHSLFASTPNSLLEDDLKMKRDILMQGQSENAILRLMQLKKGMGRPPTIKMALPGAAEKLARYKNLGTPTVP